MKLKINEERITQLLPIEVTLLRLCYSLMDESEVGDEATAIEV